jgi:spermidine/putrescine transport system permease protein
VKRDRSTSRAGAAASGVAIPFLPVGWLCALFIAPLGVTLVYSFAHAVFAGETLGFTTENFRQALSGFYLTIFLRTLEFAALGTALCLIVAMPLAYFLARKVHRYRLLLLALLLVPFWTSFLIRTIAWRTLLAPHGPIQSALAYVHLHSGPLDVLDTKTAVMIGIVYGYLPLMALPVFVALERVPAELGDASKDLGAGRWRTFVGITLPMARPGLVTGVLLTFVPMTGEYVIPALLGGDRGVLMGGLISSQYLVAQNYPLGSAMAMLVLGVLGVAVLALTRLSRSYAPVAQ